MDKKMYLEPEMEIVNLQIEGMLCLSGGGMDEETGEAGKDPEPGDGDDF